MTTEQTNVLVLKDQAGEYYLLPQATLERAQVPQEHKAQIEQLMAEQEDDTQGHFFFVFAVALAGGTAIVGGTALIVNEATKPVEPVVPTIQFPPSQEPVRGPGGRPA
ncbi:MAG: hypothetical protein ACRDJE_11870 [Dehalococcoidia bacterium]